MDFKTQSPSNSPPCEMIGSPQPFDCLERSLVPPFLSKTFDIVEERSLDPIISWGDKGESFVVWDPLEFARLILPRNFKHNNFSSFVRQLNTYGFRKIDTDRWEFANEGFLRGKKHLLKTIQRRKSNQSQQIGNSIVGPTSDTGKSGVEFQVEKLKNEKIMLMQEVIDLQQQHRGTVYHMQHVNKRIQDAEQRQKQVVSFLAKLIQNPAFVARLQQKKEQRDLGCSRVRKFIKHHEHEMGKSDYSSDGQIVKHTPDLISSLDPVPAKELSDFLLPEEPGLDSESMLHEIENGASDELIAAHKFIKTEQETDGYSNVRTDDPLHKGKNTMSPKQEVGPEYLVSFLEDLGKEKRVAELSSPGIESVDKQDIWSMDYEANAHMSSFSNEVWGNALNYDVLDFGVMDGLSDLWDLVSPQAAGGSGIDKWPAGESPFFEPDNQAGQPKDNKFNSIDP